VRRLAIILVLGCVLFAATAAADLQTPWPKSPFGTDVMQLDKDKTLKYRGICQIHL